MTRNKGLGLLALLISLFTLPPIVLAPAFFGVPIPLALYTGFIIWALLTFFIGNIFVAVWGTPWRHCECPPDRIIEPACTLRTVW